MQSPFVLTDRRRFLATLALGTAALSVRGTFAEQLARTVAQTEGPFYPDRLPLDTADSFSPRPSHANVRGPAYYQQELPHAD